MQKNALLGLLSSFLAASIGVAACGDTEQKPTGATGPATTSAGSGGAGGTGGQTSSTGAAGATTSTGATGGTGGTTTSTSTGTGGCTVAADCGISDDCHSYACDDMGMCLDKFAPMGTKTKGQTNGDCKVNVCDGTGNIISQDDNSDPFDDQKACTDDTCALGEPKHDPTSMGAACNMGGGLFCDGAGACVECLKGMDCATGVCAADHTCAPVSCGDGQKNGKETDTDCGGPVCGKCIVGNACDVGTDCIEGVCDGMTKKCSAPVCNDNVKNGDETDKDCGGPLCPDCAAGLLCASPADCLSSVCSGMPLKCQMPSCMDNVKNGAETDQDCGGGTCPACANNKLCSMGSDCVNLVCSGNPKICQMPSCSDSTKNGNETGVDCGGPCLACPNGQGCNNSGDCSSGFCNANKLCAAPTCMDSAKNGMETDVDCGGPTCPKCADGLVCAAPTDCAGAFCLGPPVCQSMLNGCTLMTAIDHTADAVTLVTQSGLVYTPQCIKIKAGNKVQIDAAYASHPLSQGVVVNGVAYPQVGGPITHTTMGTTAQFTFPSTGQFGYYCDFHYGFGMYGAVFVVP